VATVKRYNEKRNEMLRMRLAGSAPANAVVPPELNTKVIFDLDVDADIWIDARVEDRQFLGGEPPRWLVDLNVRRQIRDAQEYINCREELEHCNVECYNLRTWITEQDAAVQHAMQMCSRGMLDSDSDRIQLNLDN
jgi:hypothetical protein